MTAVEVCPICDIAGCIHIRGRATYPTMDETVEAVARAFCKRMGLDPDEDGCQIPSKSGWLEYGLRWRQVEQDAREAIAMHLAIREVLE
jgi:hypothetical protein